MLELGELVRRHGAAYLAKHGASVLPSHVRALGAIVRCRTPEMGGHLAHCEACGREHVLYHSCRHRACPRCGFDATTRWLAKQRELLLPVPYFHVVFTVPSELRRLIRSHQKVLLSVLFRAAFESLSALCADPHFLGTKQIGALAVLHTWSRTLEWHPHVHMLVPGGGLAADGQTWLRVPRRRKAFIVPEKALAKRFRGRFVALARRAIPNITLPESISSKSWIVFAKPVVHGAERVLEYLGRYVHRTALSDKALLRADDQNVTFRYRDSRDGQRKTMTLPVDEFLRRFLQHVPPKGFHRVHAFGLLHPEHREQLRRLQLLLAPRTPSVEPSSPPTGARRCPHCKQPALRILRRLTALECLEREPRAPVARAPPTSSKAVVEAQP
jgi:hypothetical protein